MQRHITDHPKDGENGSRLRAFANIERSKGRHPAYKTLHRQHKATEGGTSVDQFLRIDRGETV